MALRKEITLPSGVVVNHHRIININVDFIKRDFRLEVGSYIDVNARILDKDFVHKKTYLKGGSYFPLTDGGAVQNELYTWLKTQSEFEGAEDEIIEVSA